MNEQTLSKMKQMKLYGMHDAFTTAVETGATDHFTLDQFVTHLIDSESDDRHNRKIARNIKNAHFKYKAEIEKVEYDAQRNLEETLVKRLAECEFVKRCDNLLITGSTGVGKSYLSTALGYQACIGGYRTVYFKANRLFAKLKMAKADGSYLKELAKIERQHLLIIDDFGLHPMDNQARLSFLEIIEDRYQKGATIINSQIPVQSWYEIIGDKTIADAIMDRLVHQSKRIELEGESMRKKMPEKSEKIY